MELLRSESKRRKSCPTSIHGKGILKHRTVNDSLHSQYNKNEGKEETDSNCSSRRGIEFKEILIRTYDRTIGDNPSCSSGPPIG
jgi:hypothetical protein